MTTLPVWLLVLPTLIVYIIFQNQIQQGLTIGALKG
jgi:ABC-type glycerol-3-phosphate transport system permease component